MSIVLFFGFLGLSILMIKKSLKGEKSVTEEKLLVRKKLGYKWLIVPSVIIMLTPYIIMLAPVGMIYWIRHEHLVKEKQLMKTYLKEAYGEDFNIIKMKRLLIFFNEAPSTSAVAVLARDKKVKFPISRLDTDILENGKPYYASHAYLNVLWGSQYKEILKNNLKKVKPNLIKADVLSSNYIRNEEVNLIKNGGKAIDLISVIKKYPNEMKVRVTLFILTDKTDIESLEKATYSIIEDLRNKDNLNIYLRVVFVNNSLTNTINIFKMKSKFDFGTQMYESEFQNTEVIKRYVIESIDEVESIKELEKYIDPKVYFKKTN